MVVLALLMIPFFTNYLLRTLAWKIVLQPKGFVSNFLQDPHWFTFGQALRDGPIQVLDTRTAVQIAIVYNYLPLMIFPLWVAFDRVELHLREASKDLGANRVAHVPTSHDASRHAGHRRRSDPRVRAAVGRLRDGGAARRSEGQHGRQPRRTAVLPCAGCGIGFRRRGVVDHPILVVVGVAAAFVWFFRKLLAANRKVTVRT